MTAPAELIVVGSSAGGVLAATEIDLGNPGPADLAPPGLWFVLHTRVHQEKALAADLAAIRVDYFLPLIQRVRYVGRRKSLVEAPLFPGYVFLRGELDDAYRADRTRRVANIIKVADQAKLEWELRNIELALTNDVPLDPYPYLKAGVRVEVASGPFRGLQGVIESRARRDRLILQVEMLGQATSVEIDGALLEPID